MLHILNTKVQLFFLVTSIYIHILKLLKCIWIFFLDAVVEYDRFLTMGKKTFVCFSLFHKPELNFYRLLTDTWGNHVFVLFFFVGGTLCVDRLLFKTEDKHIFLE